MLWNYNETKTRCGCCCPLSFALRARVASVSTIASWRKPVDVDPTNPASTPSNTRSDASGSVRGRCQFSTHLPPNDSAWNQRHAPEEGPGSLLNPQNRYLTPLFFRERGCDILGQAKRRSRFFGTKHRPGAATWPDPSDREVSQSRIPSLTPAHRPGLRRARARGEKCVCRRRLLLTPRSHLLPQFCTYPVAERLDDIVFAG